MKKRLIGAAAILAAFGAAAPAFAAIDLTGRQMVVTDSAVVGGCCGAPNITYSNVAHTPVTISSAGSIVTGLNGDYGISGSAYLDPVAHRLTFYLGDSGGYAGFANWDVHIAFPNLTTYGQLTSLAYDFASSGYPLRFVSVSSSFTANTIDLVFNGSPSTTGVFAYPFLYDGATAVAGGVPEPASWALMIGGLGLAGVALRRRKGAVAA